MKRSKDGTSGVTSGSQRTTWKSSSLQVRVVGFALAVVAFAFLVIGIDRNIWQAQLHLQEGFAAIKAEKFYFGMSFRVQLRKLSDALLDYHLSGNSTNLQNFHQEARELENWLQTRKAGFVAPSERDAFAKLEASYSGFLQRVDPLQRGNGSPRVDREHFAAAYEQVTRDYQPVLDACYEVVQSEQGAFDAFLQKSDSALLSLQRLFLLSLLLLVALAVALALLVYRGMLAPLRARLSESQALLARQEKLAALGALGAGVAHEIRNPLTAIKFRLFSLQKALPPDLVDNEDARTISEEINRLDRIVKEFLQFARPAEPEVVRVPAERVLKEVQEFMKSELEQAATDLKLEVSQPVWILADTYQLKQVLINLIRNAAESIGKNGVITLGLKTGTATFAGKHRSAAILSVKDTGKGIPAEVQKRLFDPFFTTKDAGTGLGLAIAARIVEKHGGLLRYKTEINRGTTFEIVLPETGDYASKNIAGGR
ncbi:MAG: two-component system sensor histidine kinase NtrB [Limisphaerales bacterium]